ncbi:hypothetical protein [Leucobacter sp. NPDC077196]|uniref:hypothetical protein n=1 Tax=Leucobacter sp. NPDC077196 TaxID=3154959 RepID=UPI0034400573
MRPPRRTFAVLGAVVLALCATGCAAPEPPPKPEALSVTRAAAVYLEAVCPVNDAWDEADVELDRLRLATQRGVEASTSEFAASMTEIAERSAAAASSLTSDERTWPDAATDAVAAVAETLEADRDQAERVAELSAAEAAAYQWEGAVDIGSTAAEARAALELPADADAACAAWAESRERAEDAGADTDETADGAAQAGEQTSER